MGDFHPATEEYLETIFELEEAGIPPMRARLVERLGVSAPSVSETVGRLEREGYLVLGADRQMRLTPTGRAYATSMVRRHRLAERLLVDVLKVPWHQVHEEACRLEHAISPNLEAHLVTLLGDPGSCPHGNPIPGSTNEVPMEDAVALSAAPYDVSVRVSRIDEALESNTAGLRVLEEHGFIPGARVQVVSSDPDSTWVMAAGDLKVELATTVAAYVYVVPV
ncbi:MAG TPA: metal-dependent transcriptional regulator [Mycobacteriales bacterium]|nr:metal-dependent transcriptional regulator [Mycobacteriales bacterium]